MPQTVSNADAPAAENQLNASDLLNRADQDAGVDLRLLHFPGRFMTPECHPSEHAIRAL
jgi:hypothetical protein